MQHPSEFLVTWQVTGCFLLWVFVFLPFCPWVHTDSDLCPKSLDSLCSIHRCPHALCSPAALHREGGKGTSYVPLSCSSSQSAGLRGEGLVCKTAQRTAVTSEWLWVVFTSQAAAPHCVLTGHTSVALSGIQMGGSNSNRTALYHPSWALWPCLLELEWISVQGSSSCKSPSATLLLFWPSIPHCSLGWFFLSLWCSAFLTMRPPQRLTLLLPCI